MSDLESQLEKYIARDSVRKQILVQAGYPADGLVPREKAMQLGNEFVSIYSECVGSTVGWSSSYGDPREYLSLSIVSAGVNESGRYTVGLKFARPLSRASFSGSGLRSIVSLFETGYTKGDLTGRRPGGMWHGQWTIAKKHWEAGGFVESTIKRFRSEVNGRYGADAVTITVDPDVVSGSFGM